MNRARGDFGANQSRPDLHQATWISRCYPRRAGGGDVAELGREHRVRGVRLDEIVDAGAATALIGIVEGNQLEPRNSGEYGKRGLRHPLRVLQMTGCVISNP